MSARVLARVLSLALAALSAAGAQSSPSELRLESGAAQVQQKGRDARGAGVIGALWRSSGERFATLASGAFLLAGDSVTALQAIVASVFRPSIESPLQLEGGVSAAAFGAYPLGRGGNVSSFVRERFAVTNAGFWLGGAAGHTDRDGLSSHATTVDIGASLHSGGFETSLSWARVRSNDWKLLQASGIFLERLADAHDLDDVVLSAHYAKGRLSLDAARTWRRGLRASLASQTANFASASVVLSSRFSLAMGWGRQLADPVRGSPDAQVLSAVLRMVVLPWHPVDVAEGAPRALASVTPAGADGVTLVVRVAAAEGQRVVVAGTFSGWEPVPLRRTTDGWEARVTLPSGRHRVAVRIDGGPWRAPAPLGRIRDGFGGESGLVIVP